MEFFEQQPTVPLRAILIRVRAGSTTRASLSGEREERPAVEKNKRLRSDDDLRWRMGERGVKVSGIGPSVARRIIIAAFAAVST
jgi:hypothetical protein